MSSVDPKAMRVARGVAREAMADGAAAVVLTGSHARGTAGPHSDVDLVAVFRGLPDDDDMPPPVLHRSGLLVTTAATTPAAMRASFRNPAQFTTYVPGWREAIILDDPSGAAGRLQASAHRWTWDSVAGVADDWVAEEITGWAEEVHKLVDALAAGRRLHAATQRSLLAIQLAGIMAVRHRILCGTENMLWDLVAERMGEPWALVQSRALSTRGESLEVSCRAALELYALAAREAWPLLDRRQRAVVGHACAISGNPA